MAIESGRADYLPLDEAAARLGVSRLKLREAVAKGLIPARRDNRGRLRVDLAGIPDDLTSALAMRAAPPEALIEALFDEIEELQAEREEEADGAARLAALVERQQAALEASTAALEAERANAARLAGLLARAAGLAEDAASRSEALAATAGRAMALLDRTAAELATARAEAARAQALLDRAMVANAALETDNAEKARVIESQNGMVDRLFSLSETALSTATRARAEDRPGLFHRMFGRSRGPHAQD